MSNDTDNRVSELDAAIRERDALAAVIEEARAWAGPAPFALSILHRTPSDVLVERDARIRAEVIDWIEARERRIESNAPAAREHFGLTKGADRG